MSEIVGSIKWMKGVAMTTGIFAVFAAVSILMGGNFDTETSVLTTHEANAWSYFQSKSIKQNLFEVNLDNILTQRIVAGSPEQQKFLDDKIAEYGDEIKRYKIEKAEIKAKAEAFSAQQEHLQVVGNLFDLATMLLEISIMISSVSALVSRKSLWYMGILIGSGGTILMMYAFSKML